MCAIVNLMPDEKLPSDELYRQTQGENLVAEQRDKLKIEDHEVSEVTGEKNNWTLYGVAGLLVLGSMGGYYWLRTSDISKKDAVSDSIVIQPTSIPTAFMESEHALLPPLYPGLEWEATESGEFEFSNSDGDVVRRTGYSIKSRITKERPDAVVDYYASELQKLGWQENLAADAFGPGGGIYGYYRGDGYLEVGIHPRSGSPEDGFTSYQATVKYTEF